MNEFLNSRSMLTPGFAGAMVMVLANSISSAFGMTSFLSYVVLALSFLIGIIVLSDNNLVFSVRFPLYILNSLIIFSMAYGSNSLGKAAEKNTDEKEIIESIIKPIGEGLSGFNRQNTSLRFVFTQNPTTIPTKEVLKNQVITLSSSILLVQEDLVSNQKVYSDPQQKLEALININKNLTTLNEQLAKDSDLSVLKFNEYQQGINNIQLRVNTFQRGLSLEKKKPVKKTGFFKDWSN
jgi:hypothetical protein